MGELFELLFEALGAAASAGPKAFFTVLGVVAVIAAVVIFVMFKIDESCTSKGGTYVTINDTRTCVEKNSIKKL